MSLPITILRTLSSFPMLTGVGLVAIGLGVVEMEPDLENVAAAVLGSPPHLFFYVFLGSSKILGTLGLWGQGVFSKPLSMVALGTPAACAVYGHSQLGETEKTILAVSYLVILSALGFLENQAKSSSSSTTAKGDDSKTE